MLNIIEKSSKKENPFNYTTPSEEENLFLFHKRRKTKQNEQNSFRVVARIQFEKSL